MSERRLNHLSIDTSFFDGQSARSRSLSRSALTILTVAEAHPLERRHSSPPHMRGDEFPNGHSSNSSIEWVRTEGSSSADSSGGSSLSAPPESPVSSAASSPTRRSSPRIFKRLIKPGFTRDDSIDSLQDSSEAEPAQASAGDREEELFPDLYDRPQHRKQLFLSTKKFVQALLKQRLPAEDQLDEVLRFLQAQERTIGHTPLWNIDRLVMKQLIEELRSYLYRKLFKSILVVTKSEDEVLFKRLEKMHWLSLRNLEIPEDCFNEDLWTAARHEFESIASVSTPTEKLVCILNCCKILVCMLEESGSMAGADDFLPLLVYLIAKVNIANLQSIIYFIEDYTDAETMDGENECFFVHLKSAVSFLMSADAKSLNMDPIEFDRLMENQMKTSHGSWRNIRNLLSIDRSPGAKKKRDLKGSGDSSDGMLRPGSRSSSRESLGSSAVYEATVGSLGRVGSTDDFGALRRGSVDTNGSYSSPDSASRQEPLFHLSPVRPDSAQGHRPRSVTEPVRPSAQQRPQPLKLEPKHGQTTPTHVSFNLPPMEQIEAAEDVAEEAEAAADAAEETSPRQSRRVSRAPSVGPAIAVIAASPPLGGSIVGAADPLGAVAAVVAAPATPLPAPSPTVAASVPDELPTSSRSRADSLTVEPLVVQALSERFPFFGRQADELTAADIPQLLRGYKELALLVSEQFLPAK